MNPLPFIGMMLAIHTLLQAVLGVMLHQPYQALCAAIALPAVLIVAGAVSYVVSEVIEAVWYRKVGG